VFQTPDLSPPISAIRIFTGDDVGGHDLGDELRRDLAAEPELIVDRALVLLGIAVPGVRCCAPRASRQAGDGASMAGAAGLGRSFHYAKPQGIEAESVLADLVA
jgi:hypothetical protein